MDIDIEPPAVKNRSRNRAVSAGSDLILNAAVLPTGRALVVDDNPNACDIAAKGLELLGFEVQKAENGEEACHYFFQDRFDLVVTDFQMPLMDGAALIRKIKSKSPHTPVILVSGQLREDLAEVIEPRYISAVLQKPYLIKSLQRAALEAVGSRQARSTPASLQPVIQD